jgi:hypothetical protein
MFPYYSGQPDKVAVMGIPVAFPLKVSVILCMFPGARYHKLVGIVSSSLSEVLILTQLENHGLKNQFIII